MVRSRRTARLPVALLLGLAVSGPAGETHDPASRQITFEERVAAQEAIERVYYRHQIGASKPFEEAVPRALLEKKVLTYLKLSAALEALWHTPVTSEMLEGELRRIARDTRFPQRLRRLHDALGDDPVLIQECLARPVLVDRLARNFFAHDARIHDAARREAEALRERLARGGAGAGDVPPDRGVAEIARAGRREAVAAPAPPPSPAGPPVRRPPRTTDGGPDEPFRPAPGGAGLIPGRAVGIGPVVEEREAFVIRVSRDEDGAGGGVATYTVRKRAWDDWWSGVSGALDERSVRTVASAAAPLPDSGAPAAAPCAPDDTWDSGSLGAVPDYRVGHTAIWTGSAVVIWGGTDGGNVVHRTGSRYDPLTDTWSAMSTAGAPAGRANHTAVWTGSRMIVWGGDDNFNRFFDTGGAYDPVTDTWAPLTTSQAPDARSGHVAVWTGGVMVVWGGTGPLSGGNPGGTIQLRTGGRYDPLADTWEPTTLRGAPRWRRSHTAVWTGSRMIVWGGYSGAYYDTGALYDPVADSWTDTSTAGAPAARSDHSSVWTGREMVVWGGYNGSWLASGGRYDPATDTWTPTSMAGAPPGTYAHAAVWDGVRMIVWGGSLEGTGGRYDPLADTWLPTSTTGAPRGRFGHQAVWTGDRMVVWGGLDYRGYNPPVGARYDPIADVWTPMATSGAPPARKDHTAVWTGTQMIVWGGYNGEALGVFGAGARYDPVTDAWTPTTMLGAPARRADHAAVWTGREMIVWGGWGSPAADTQRGGAYDPVADAWRSLSVQGAPEPRFDAAAVWTGTEMIVWGGEGSQYLASGGRYDPATDTWLPTSATGAPSPRRGHTGIWTGSEMIVWGGLDPSFRDLGGGGRYDPAADTWRGIPTNGAPPARRDHVAVWTGREMLIWGGLPDGCFPCEGGRYDPATDAWRAIPTLNAPLGTFSGTAVWTGTHMIVWGGFQFGDPGGRYDPATDTWSPTSGDRAPTTRHRHTAVWTGAHMIVWGGWTSNAYLESGGRYAFGHGRDDDGDGLSECAGDCNDAAASVFPGAPELCDSLDNDCDGVPDEDFDLDGDLWRTCAGDCDDADSLTHPRAAEICDGRDNDCNAAVDDAPDTDGDGAGDCADCAPGDAGSIAAAAPVSGLDVADVPGGYRFTWASQAAAAGSGTSYDVFAGSASASAGAGGSFSGGSCAAEDLLDSFFEHFGPDPPPGDALYFVFRAQNSCGTGSYGTSDRDATAAQSTRPCM